MSVTDPSQREELQIEGLRDSITFTRDIIKTEATAVTPAHIILLGLSQGSATGTSFQWLPYSSSMPPSATYSRHNYPHKEKLIPYPHSPPHAPRHPPPTRSLHRPQRLAAIRSPTINPNPTRPLPLLRHNPQSPDPQPSASSPSEHTYIPRSHLRRRDHRHRIRPPNPICA